MIFGPTKRILPRCAHEGLLSIHDQNATNPPVCLSSQKCMYGTYINSSKGGAKSLSHCDIDNTKVFDSWLIKTNKSAQQS